jgi:parallel beta-helix repeat protein
MPDIAIHASTLVRWTIVALLALAVVPAAHAETTQCLVIPTLPNALVSSNHYCLDKDFDQAFTQTAIQVNADGIVLDCNGHTIRNTNQVNTPAGIAGYSRQNVVIRNCVVDGFMHGISLGSSSDTAATGNLIEGNTILNTRQIGVSAIGSHIRIERNRITNVDGSYNGVAYGMQVYSSGNTGVGVTIKDNVISDFRGTYPITNQSPTGISFFNLRGTEVTGNVITGLYASTGNRVHGIESYASASVLRDNVVIAPPPLPAPLDGQQEWAIGIFDSTAGSVCRDNIVGGFTTGIGGCTKSANTEF